MQSALTARVRQPAVAAHGGHSRGRKLSLCVQARRSSSDSSPEILTAFFYGRALAITLNRRLSEAVIDIVSDISKAMAERPQRIADFQDEVLALARKEMSGSGFLPERTSASSAAGAGGAAGGGKGVTAAGPQDPQAAIDDLRSEIAYARASLNEIRAAQRASAAQN